MTASYPAPDASPPHRVLILGAATRGWYEADAALRRDAVLPRLRAVCAGWALLGARLIVTLDDDILMAGEPAGGGWTWYLVYEVPSLQAVADMLHGFRREDGGVRLDRYFRLETRICRPFLPIEPVAIGPVAGQP